MIAEDINEGHARKCRASPAATFTAEVNIASKNDYVGIDGRKPQKAELQVQIRKNAETHQETLRIKGGVGDSKCLV